MQYLIYILFLTIFNAEFLFAKLGLKFRLLAILPEMISIIVGVYVLLYFAFNKRAKIRARYLFFYFALLVHIAIGLIGNQVQPLAVLSGLRIYLKFLPFYFLPLVYEQTNAQIKIQLNMLLLFAILQCPLAFYQRLFEYQFYSGDLVAGTLGTAPMLTLFLVSAISMLIGFYLKKMISMRTFIILLIIAFLPTAINETKATLILLPFAILVPTLFGVGKEKRLKIIVTVIPVLILLVVGFHYLYKIFYGERTDVLDFYTTDKLSNYIYKDSEADQVEGKEGDYGRVDTIILAYHAYSGDLFRMVWGVGIGNAAKSFSRKLEGQHASEYKRLGGKGTGIAHFMWEIGMLGLGYVLWFLLLVFIDAMNLRKQEDLIGPVALGWMGVTVIALLTLPYQNIIAKDALVYTFLYFSGLLAAMNYKAQKTAHLNQPHPVYKIN